MKRILRLTLIAVVTIAVAAAAFADSGAIWTSKGGCSTVDANLYESKGEIYLNGGPAGGGSNGLPAGNYWVRVIAPGGELLGMSLTANAVVDDTGRFVACYKVWDLVYFPDGITPGFADTPNSGDEYKLQVSQTQDFSGGTVKNDNFKVVCTIPDTPAIAAPAAVCSGSAGNTATVTNFNASFQYSWSVTNGTLTGGQGTASITFTAGASGTTVVSVTASNFSPSCSSSGSATVVIDDPPTLTATGGGTFCAGTMVTLTASGTNVNLANAVWTDAGNNVVGNGATFSTNVAGTYTVNAPSTNTCAAPAAASQTIALDPPPTLSASGGGHYCDGSTATLTASGTNVDLAHAVWTDAGSNVVGSGPTFTTNVAGTYTVTAASTNTCPAPAAASQTVIFDPHPTLSASGGGHFCDGSTVTLTATGSNVDLANAVWTDSGNNAVGSGPTFSTNVGGTYTVNAPSTDACPAPAGASQTIILDPHPTLSASGDGTHICQGSSTTLTASGSNVDLANATWTLNGNPVGSGPTFTVPNTLAPGAYTYVVSAASTDTCSNPAPASATVTVDPTPTISIQGNKPFCDGSSITLTTNSSNVSGYQWSFNGNPISGATSSSLSVTKAGTYSVVGTSANVCANPTDSAVVVVNPNPPAAPITAPSVVCAGSGNLAASTTASAASYSWGITNGTIVSGQGTTAITFTAGFDALHGVKISLTVTNSFGCATTSSVVVGNEACIEGCSLTQGAWGSSGGAGNAATELALICPPHQSCNPIVSGTGSKSFTLLGSVAEENCLVLRMPAGGTPAVLPANGAGTTLFNLSTCGTTAVSGGTDLLLKNGKFNNVLLGQTITLALDVRQNPSLATVVLCPTIKAQAVIHTPTGDVLNPGPDGILGTADDPIATISIPQSVLTKLGSGATVANLLALANTALGGGSISPATLSDVNTAVNNINVGFDGCRIEINCLPVSTLSAAALQLASSNASVALCGISDDMPASLIVHVRNRNMPADLQTLRDLSDLARDGHDVGIPAEDLNRAIDAVNAAVENGQPLDGCR